MRVVKPDKLGLLHRVFENDGRCFLVVSVFVFMPLSAPKRLAGEIEMWAVVGEELGAEGGLLDEGNWKPRGELLVTGKCFPPRGEATAVSFVRVRLGAIDKRLAVIGDRQWKHGVPTEPVPFREMPVDWSHAFGGEGYLQNPVGRGYGPVEVDGAKIHALPNIELPKQLIVSPSDRRQPAGFGAYDISWPQRASKAGTYGQRWLETRYPGYAEDFDSTIFDVAPEDQWLAGYFNGDEPFLIENMHPESARIEGSLARLVVRAIVDQEAAGTAALKEVPMRLDTVRLVPHRDRAVLVFRGLCEIAEDDADDIKHLIVAAEDPAEPRPLDHYRAVLGKRLDPERSGFETDADLMPPEAAGWASMPDRTETHDLIEREDLLKKNVERRAERERAETIAYLQARGLDPADYGFGADELRPKSPGSDREQVLADLAELEKLAQTKAAEGELRKVEITERARAVYAAQGLDYDQVVAQTMSDAAGPPKFTAAGHIEQMEQLLGLAREGGEPIEQLEEQLADPAYRAQLEDYERSQLAMYRGNAHIQPAVAPRELGSSEHIRTEIELARHNGLALTGRDFTGADLSALDLSGMDLSGSLFESANFTCTKLNGCRLDGAVLAHATLNATELDGASLENANLGGARIDGASLVNANLTNAILIRTEISATTFRGAKLERAQLFETKFGEGVDWSDIAGRRLSIIRVDMAGICFARADLSQTVFLDLSVAGADFSGATLTKTCFAKVRGDGAIFRGVKGRGARFVHESTFAGADFRDAALLMANFRGTNLAMANFCGADVRKSDYGGCNLAGASFYRAKARGALMIRANLTDANMVSVDLLDGLLSKAILRGTDLTGANLFRADLSRVRVDGRTKLDDANMAFARQLPRAKDESTRA